MAARGRGRPRRVPPPDPDLEPIPDNSTEHFSPLLWMTHAEHRVSLASIEVLDYFFKFKFCGVVVFSVFYVVYFFQHRVRTL